MRYMAIIDADEKPVSCEFIGCNGNVTPYLIGTTTNIKDLEQEPFMNKPCVAHQVCHEDKVKVLDKIRAEIERQEKWLMDAGYNAYNVDIAFSSIKLVIDRYKAESENP